MHHADTRRLDGHAGPTDIRRPSGHADLTDMRIQRTGTGRTNQANTQAWFTSFKRITHEATKTPSPSQEVCRNAL